MLFNNETRLTFDRCILITSSPSQAMKVNFTSKKLTCKNCTIELKKNLGWQSSVSTSLKGEEFVGIWLTLNLQNTKSILKIFLYPKAPFLKHPTVWFPSYSIKFTKDRYHVRTLMLQRKAATNYDLKGTVRRVTFGKHWFQLLLTTMSTRECTGQDTVPLDHLVVADHESVSLPGGKTGLPQWRSLTFHTRTIEITIFKALYVQHTSALKRIPATRWSLCLFDP